MSYACSVHVKEVGGEKVIEGLITQDGKKFYRNLSEYPNAPAKFGKLDVEPFIADVLERLNKSMTKLGCPGSINPKGVTFNVGSRPLMCAFQRICCKVLNRLCDLGDAKTTEKGVKSLDVTQVEEFWK